jgi:hypothetical protein
VQATMTWALLLRGLILNQKQEHVKLNKYIIIKCNFYVRRVNFWMHYEHEKYYEDEWSYEGAQNRMTNIFNCHIP